MSSCGRSEHGRGSSCGAGSGRVSWPGVGCTRTPSCLSPTKGGRSASRISSGWRWPLTCLGGMTRAQVCGRGPVARCLRRRDTAHASRCAFWLAFELLHRGQSARGSGWVTRAQRLIDEEQLDCVEQGYLGFLAGLCSAFAGEWRRAYAGFEESAAIGVRFSDVDLVTLGRQGQGRALIYLGDTAGGMTLLDEAMVATVTAGDVFCGSRRGRLLQCDRGVPRGLRPAPGAAVDGGTQRMVCVSAGPGPIPRAMSGASVGDHAVAR